MATKKKSELFSALLYIVIGVLLAIFKEGVLDWAIFLVGAIFIISGILEVAKKNYTGGAISLIIGIAILILGGFLKDIVFLVLGILIAVKGFVALIDALKAKNKNALNIVFPVLTIAFGILLAFGNLVGRVIFVAGILLVIDGVIGLVGAIKK
jgi:uncharacterized membrane protein HdeD (DUF308 family)